MLRIARAILLLLALLASAGSVSYVYFLVTAPNFHSLIYAIAAGLLAWAAFYLSQGLRDTEAAPEITGRKKGDTIALAGFSFLALIFGLLAFSAMPFALQYRIVEDEDTLKTLATTEGMRAATIAASATLLTIALGLNVIRPRRWLSRASATTGKGFRHQFFQLFLLTFFFPGLFIELFNLMGGVDQIGTDAHTFSFKLGTLARTITNGILWPLLGLKAARHLRNTNNPPPTESHALPTLSASA